MNDIFAAAGTSGNDDDDDFDAFAAAPPPVDPFAVDDPFADIVHSSAAAATTTATTAPAAAATSSPLLSFSPVAAASAPTLAEAELLSFSPLQSATSAPSTLSPFLLDALAPETTTTSSSNSSNSNNNSSNNSGAPAKGSLLLPPPRFATAPMLSPVRAGPLRAASFAGHAPVGELLSFSPVASAGTSFADSFGSSSAGAATTSGTSVFDDDELFSLSTIDMGLELPAGLAEPRGVYTAAFASPAALSSSTNESGSEAANTPADGRSANEDVYASAFLSPNVPMSPAFGSGSTMACTPLQDYDDVSADSERMLFSSSKSDNLDGKAATDVYANVASDLVSSVIPVDSKWDGDDVFENGGESFVDHSPTAADMDQAAPSSEARELDATSATGANNAVVNVFEKGDDAFSAFDKIEEPDNAPRTVLGSSAASFDETKDNDFGDFGADTATNDADFGDFGETSTADIGDFGDFAHSTSGGAGIDENDDFGDFAQSSNGIVGGAADADDDDFGDFVQSSGGTMGNTDDDDDEFSDFAPPSSFSGGSNFAAVSHDDDFGDFSSPPPQMEATPSSFVSGNATLASSAAESTSDLDLETFFSQAFPVQSIPAPLEAAPLVPSAPSAPTRNSFKDLFQDTQALSASLVSTIYRAAVESYFQSGPSATDAGIESYRMELQAIRLQHLKFVLTEKIQEASRHDGIFPHGSEKHHVLLSLVNSDDEKKMREALATVQLALFNSSVNDAMMRFARQAALSAKAKIAEQAAHQQASSRGSLLATTRQLLSRSGGGGGGTSTSGSGSHDTSDAAGASSSGYGGGSGNGEDVSGENTISGSESTGRRRHSGSGEADFAPRGSSGGGGLMKKFQDRFSSFSSSRGRTRVVSLRRKGQSGEDVRTMELNLDSISGGLDQVKWKCAVFLYDVDEVAQVAPSQIRILAYPSREVLAAKSDRAALLKFLKPGAIWTIDIGASNNDVLNAW